MWLCNSATETLKTVKTTWSMFINLYTNPTQQGKLVKLIGFCSMNASMQFAFVIVDAVTDLIGCTQKTLRCCFQIYALGDPVSKNSGFRLLKRWIHLDKCRYDTKYLRIQLNVCLCVWGFTVIVFSMTV